MVEVSDIDSLGKKTITAKQGTAIITGERVEAIAGAWDLEELQHLFGEMDKLRHSIYLETNLML